MPSNGTSYGTITWAVTSPELSVVVLNDRTDSVFPTPQLCQALVSCVNFLNPTMGHREPIGQNYKEQDFPLEY